MPMTEVVVGALAGAFGGAAAGWSTAYFTARMQRADTLATERRARNYQAALNERHVEFEAATGLWATAHQAGAALAEHRRTGVGGFSADCVTALRFLASEADRQGMVLPSTGQIFTCGHLIEIVADLPNHGAEAQEIAEQVVRHLQWVMAAILRNDEVPPEPDSFDGYFAVLGAQR